jgi:A/G-specific adenine glycosylase
MAETPTSEWLAGDNATNPLEDAPLQAEWRRLAHPVRHVFTHFPLDLAVMVAQVPTRTPAPAGMRFTPRANLHEEPLSTLMRKVLTAGLEALDANRAASG